MTDFPALVVDAVDVPMASVIAQLRAIASGMEANLPMDHVRVTFLVKVSFRQAEDDGGQLDQ